MRYKPSLLLLIILSQALPAQDFLQDWESVLARSDPDYQESFDLQV